MGAILFLILNSVLYGVNSNKLPIILPYHYKILNFYFFQFKKFPPNTLTPIIHSESLTIATPNYLIGSRTISSVALLLTASVDLLLILWISILAPLKILGSPRELSLEICCLLIMIFWLFFKNQLIFRIVYERFLPSLRYWLRGAPVLRGIYQFSRFRDQLPSQLVLFSAILSIVGVVLGNQIWRVAAKLIGYSWILRNQLIVLKIGEEKKNQAAILLFLYAVHQGNKCWIWSTFFFNRRIPTNQCKEMIDYHHFATLMK